MIHVFKTVFFATFCWLACPGVLTLEVPDVNVTVCLHEQHGTFQVTTKSCSNVAATANFTNEINSTGWSFLEVVSSQGFTNEMQAYAMGLAEARATAGLIAMHWRNTVQGYCDGAEMYCVRLQNYIEKNLEWIKIQIRRNPSDPYWTQVQLSLYQLSGLQDGYDDAWVKTPNLDISPLKLLMFQINGELEDLEQAFGRPKHLLKRTFGSGSCSAFIKAVGGDLWVSHDTWSTYSDMLRVQKLYVVKFSISGGGSLVVPGNTISMSSYPGSLISIDDFYIVSSGLVITETTIGNQNASLWKYIRPMDSVQAWIRTSVANRLATTTDQWAKVFARDNSGTYNNQWMIVDYKLFYPSAHSLPSRGLFRVLEQLPGYVQSADMTKVLTSQGYWASYNLPYFENIYNMSGTPESMKKFGNFFSYQDCPRSMMFKRGWRSVTDEASLIKLMRFNNYTHDPLAACNCTPPYSGENGIAARCDLNPKNGTYPFSTLGFRCHGATDMKATNLNLFKRFQFIGISGPTSESLPVFSWSNSSCASLQKHEGQPNLWNFQPIVHEWKNLMM